MTAIPKELMSDLQKYADMSEDTKRLCMRRILEKDPSLRLILLVPDLFEKVMVEMEILSRYRGSELKCIFLLF